MGLLKVGEFEVVLSHAQAGIRFSHDHVSDDPVISQFSQCSSDSSVL